MFYFPKNRRAKIGVFINNPTLKGKSLEIYCSLVPFNAQSYDDLRILTYFGHHESLYFYFLQPCNKSTRVLSNR